MCPEHAHVLSNQRKDTMMSGPVLHAYLDNLIESTHPQQHGAVEFPNTAWFSGVDEHWRSDDLCDGNLIEMINERLERFNEQRGYDRGPEKSPKSN